MADDRRKGWFEDTDRHVEAAKRGNEKKKKTSRKVAFALPKGAVAEVRVKYLEANLGDEDGE